MSADALQSAIDTLYKDEHVIVTTESDWYDNLQATIHQANKTPKAEAPYYASYALILGTYASTCSHPDLEVAVTPQGRFEAKMDFSSRVKRQASDFSLTVVLKDSDGPEEVRLGGWLEAKPMDRSCVKKADKNRKRNADVDADPGKRDGIDGQDKAEGADAGDKAADASADDKAEDAGADDKAEDADVEDKGAEADGDVEEGTWDHIEEDGDMEDEGEDTEGEVDEMETEDEDEEADGGLEKVVDDLEEAEASGEENEQMDAEGGGMNAEDEQMDAEDEGMDAENMVKGTDDSDRAGPEDGADSRITTGDTDQDKTGLDTAKENSSSRKMIQRLVADLPQLCKQAHHAFHEYPGDVFHALLTYGMRFSCFRFTRPAKWDSVRGTEELKHTIPDAVFSDESVLLDGKLNPCFLQAIHLMTASLGLSYQPSWFQLPSGHYAGPPDLFVARDAISQYRTKLEGEPASPPRKAPPPDADTPGYKPTGKEATTPAAKSERELRSSKRRSNKPKSALRPAENGSTETSEPAHEEQDCADLGSSDTDGSPLINRLQPKSTRAGPATSGASGAAGPSTKDPRNLAGDARSPVFKALASGVKSKNKFVTPKNRGKQTSKARGKARQQENTASRTEASDPARLSTFTSDAPTGNGLGDSGSQMLGNPSTSQEAAGDDSRTGAPSRAKSGKRKGRPSSPLGDDSPNPVPEDSAPAPAGPSKKRRLAPRANDQSVDDIVAGSSRTSRMEPEVSTGATNARDDAAANARDDAAANARDDAAAERVCNPLAAPERARLNTRIYKTRKRAARTAETDAAITEPEVSRPRTRAATASLSQIHDPPPKKRNTKNTRK